MRFDVGVMFARVGGYASGMQDLLHRQVGQAPGLQAIQMWKQRSKIPADWLASVLYALAKEGHRVFDFVVRD